EKHYETAKKAVGIANKLFQIVLGGTIDSNILRDIKDEAASIAHTYADEHWHFIKGAEILADIVLDMQEFIMQKSRDAHKESAFNASWSTRDKLWTLNQYEAQKKEEFAQRNFKNLVGWLFAMFYHNDNESLGIQKIIKSDGGEDSKKSENSALLWSWWYKQQEIKVFKKENRETKINNKSVNSDFFKDKKHEKDWNATLVRWRFEDITWNEGENKNPIKKRKWETIKSITAKNGLFDAVIKTIKLINDWDNKKPDSRAQELVKITVEATASIAKIVKNLKTSSSNAQK
ncbi:hypothetical protein, partial [Mycoplasma phocimorsus]|uniref:hypothetical protein n=1 Tax=Mycoplasma phocimorsus TaxID=3045839 RepID=UPI0024BFEF7B